ncbi:MAG: T9SS type A sorting domain-containing protein [Lentimicrobiaceae bacterium]|jgi:hypothetical protein|nr:T9SS type A sorting domain-containing protein [Lentimicrobiaceae bacterium]
MYKFKLNLRKVVAIATCLVASVAVFAQTTDVYVGGAANGKATVWKNEIPQYLSESGEILSVVVVDGNVYAIGIEGVDAKVWKNNEVLYSLTVTSPYYALVPTSIAISGNDIYVTTYELTETFSYIGRFWKNGLEQSNYEDAAELQSVFVDGDDVYVAGRTNSLATIWRNGTPIYTYDSDYDASFISVVVADGDVYYMGGDYGGYGKNALKDNTIKREPISKNTNDYGVNVWKNDEILYTLDTEVYGGDLYFSNGVLYAVGQTPDANAVYQAKIWVDGVGTVLENVWSAASSVFVDGTDVYVAGFRGDYPELDAIIWKNGEAIPLTTDGYNSANSVFIVGESTGISEIENTNVEIYPNPVKDVLKIENNELQINKIEILNLLGKTIYQFDHPSNQINSSALSQGIYFVKLETNKGIVIKKFVKE